MRVHRLQTSKTHRGHHQSDAFGSALGLASVEDRPTNLGTPFRLVCRVLRSAEIVLANGTTQRECIAGLVGGQPRADSYAALPAAVKLYAPPGFPAAMENPTAAGMFQTAVTPEERCCCFLMGGSGISAQTGATTRGSRIYGQPRWVIRTDTGKTLHWSSMQQRGKRGRSYQIRSRGSLI